MFRISLEGNLTFELPEQGAARSDKHENSVTDSFESVWREMKPLRKAAGEVPWG